MKFQSSAILIALMFLIFPSIDGPDAFGQTPNDSDRGPNFVLAVEDTISFSGDQFDTLLVSAPRVKVEELIKAISERIERDTNLIKVHEFTVLNTFVVQNDSDPNSGNYSIFESAVRQRSARGEGLQTVLLWDRERHYKNGELDEDKHEEEEFKTEWHDIGEGIRMAAPFSGQEGDKYKYQIEDRHIVGNNVVYKILFEPKNQFDRLPSGTVWVDFSDLVLRRIEARFTESVPFPLFLKAIPFLRSTQKKLGDFWVPYEFHAQIELRNVPLPDFPNNVEARSIIQDQIINGVAYNEDGTVKESDSSGGAK